MQVTQAIGQNQVKKKENCKFVIVICLPTEH